MVFGVEFVAFTVLIALFFDFWNGVNDAANSTATIVATRVLRPFQAVALAAVFNFLGPFVFGTAVAATVGKGIVVPAVVTTELILSGLVGAIAWTWLCTRYGLPISVSHSLIGGLIGAALAAAGAGGLELPHWPNMAPAFETMGVGALAGAALAAALALARRGAGLGPTLLIGAFLGSGLWLAVQIFRGIVVVKGLFATVLFIFYSPMLGFVGSYVLDLVVLALFRRANPSNMRRWFGRTQLLSASFYSLGHGTNDGQKTMGVIMAVLIANGYAAADPFHIPPWVILASASAIALGTLIGGWRVVQTMGMRLTRLETHQGFSAETSSAFGLFFLAKFGVPVSTTHSITGSILGVGALHGGRRVRWQVARTIVGAWVLTLPAAATAAAVVYAVLTFVLGLVG